MELDPRFKIRAPLRCEGIGRLDCAEDLESGMRMAVRWLPLEANGSAAVLACEQLPEHPTLPRIRQIGQIGTSAYVAMDFPDGNLLATLLHEPSPLEVLIGITGQIADALATIHAQGVFHGEMSADSILLVSAPSKKAYLWDMPLVIANRLTDRRGEERLMYQLVKSAPYLSPERARGGKPTAESDVYALGAIICIAGGAVLPVGDTTLAVVHSVAVGAWAPKVPSSVPPQLRQMVERMVAAEPSARPSAREVAELFLPSIPPAHRTEPEMPAIVVPAPVPTAPAYVMSAYAEVLGPTAELPELPAHPAPRRKVPLLVAAALAVLVLVLGALAIDFSHSGLEPKVSTAHAATPSSAKAANSEDPAPVAASAVVESSDDELSPLTPRKRPAAKRRAPKVEVAAENTEREASEPPAQGELAPADEDPELKRPTF